MSGSETIAFRANGYSAAPCVAVRTDKWVESSRRAPYRQQNVKTIQRKITARVEAGAVMRVAIPVTSRGWLPLKGWSETKKMCPTPLYSVYCWLKQSDRVQSDYRTVHRRLLLYPVPSTARPGPRSPPATRQLFSTALLFHIDVAVIYYIITFLWQCSAPPAHVIHINPVTTLLSKNSTYLSYNIIIEFEILYITL